MFTRIFAFFMALVMAITPMAASASGLDGVLDSLSQGAVANVNSPGRFSSQARTSMVLGGFEMRVPGTKNAPTLVSFTPPRVDASCSGVSAFFGGFSFISGKEFESLLKNIASGAALGFVAHLALKTLCPQCEAVVQLMQRLNQIASMAAKDACKYGAAAADAFAKWAGIGGNSSDQNAKCTKAGEGGSNSGETSDFFSGLNSLCGSIQQMNETLDKSVIGKMKEWAAAGASESEVNTRAAEERLKLQQGNATWIISGAFFPPEDSENIKPRTLILNMFGTTIYPDAAGPGYCGGTDQSDKPQVPCPPQVSADEMMELFMCGVEAYAPKTEVSPSVNDVCSQTVGWDKAKLANRKFYECDEPEKCMKMNLVQYDKTTVLNKYVGLHYQVNKALRAATKRVASGNQRLWDGTESDKTGKAIVTLIQMAPYPLYQAINAAAVYPAASAEILDSLTVVIGEQLALSYFNEFLRTAGRANRGSGLPPEMIESMQKAMGTFTNRVDAIKSKTATNIAVQEGITQSIRSLNQAVQRQVMTEEIFGGNQFGRGLSSMVSSGTGGGTRTTAAAAKAAEPVTP